MRRRLCTWSSFRPRSTLCFPTLMVVALLRAALFQCPGAISVPRRSTSFRKRARAKARERVLDTMVPEMRIIAATMPGSGRATRIGTVPLGPTRGKSNGESPFVSFTCLRYMFPLHFCSAGVQLQSASRCMKDVRSWQSNSDVLGIVVGRMVILT
jgi:hypothetical protein